MVVDRNFFMRIAIVSFLLVFISLSDARGQQRDLSGQQVMAEASVEKHIKSSMGSKGTYSGYGFGTIEILVPRDILYLNELKENRKTAVGMKEYFGQRYDSVIRSYDSQIASQEKLIVEKKVRDNYKISHIFSISMAEGVRLMEADFFLSANFRVKDLKLKTDAQLSKEDHEWFLYFIKGNDLFVSGTPQENAKRTSAVYSHFGDRLETFSEDKTELIFSLVNAIRVIRIEQKYDPQSIASAVIQSWMKRRSAQFPAYMPGDFSIVQALYQAVSGEEVIVGYSVFHRFSLRGSDGLPGLKCLYFELDPWFVTAGTMIVDPPFDRHFESR